MKQVTSSGWGGRVAASSLGDDYSFSFFRKGAHLAQVSRSRGEESCPERNEVRVGSQSQVKKMRSHEERRILKGGANYAMAGDSGVSSDGTTYTFARGCYLVREYGSY